MGENGVLVFPDAGSGRNNSSIDPALLLALGNGGGFGNMNPFWMMFMLPFIYPFFGSMMGGNGWFGNGWGGNNGTGFLANQLNNDAGRDLILQAINGRADALGQIANILNTSVESVRSGINSLNTDLVVMDGNNKLTGAQIINAIQAGNTALGQQLANCCCENRLAICQQTSTLQADSARNFAAQQLQTAQNHAEDRLDVCQQTNAIVTNDDRNTRAITDAIAAQSIMINDKFCELEKRELLNRIDVQGDLITQLRGQISNDKQTETFGAAFRALDDKIDAIAAKQPNTVPVIYPNLVAVNQTPYGGYPYGGYPYGYPQNNFWG